ncbi:MAG: SCO family protein [Aquificota bacterium]|nr:SCO family protein [Aquificota bacterium]
MLTVLLASCEEKFNGIVKGDPAENFCLKGWKGGKEREVCLEDFRGKVVLIFFGYTHCPDVCPVALDVLKKTLSLLRDREREKVQVIFISVDPERDTPEIAQRYAEYFDPSFIGLTGSHEDLKKITKAYFAFYRKVGEGKDYLVDHTAYIYLIDRKGVLRLIYPSRKQKPELIAEDIKKIL